jgi:putative SOS response-associated peptidase YedK
MPQDRRIFAFREAGGTRGPVLGPHFVYGVLTTSPNAVVEPIHPKAMPVILSQCFFAFAKRRGGLRRGRPQAS